VSVQQQLALDLGCTTRQLWDHAPFRGRLRPLPSKESGPAVEGTLLPTSLVRPGARPPPRPLLSIMCVRWYDYWSEPASSSDYNTLNDGMLWDLLEGPRSVAQEIPLEYEVVTVFVRQTRDFARLQPRSLRALLRGRNVVGWYLVWPSSDAEGFVSEGEFFRFVHAVERLPVRTAWPHAAALYRTLCGKLFVPQMCLNAAYRVPPTTRIQRAEFQRHGLQAATRALRCLLRLRSRLWGAEAVPLEEFRGVAKLGFSWGGQDVLPFKGVASLVGSLARLFDFQGCEATSCLVQAMVPGVIGEHRVLCFYDMLRGSFHRESVWMSSAKPDWRGKHAMPAPDAEGFRLATSTTIAPARVALELFDCDFVAKRAAEEAAQRLTDLWLRWFLTESPEPPQVTRIDFLVAHRGPGESDVWTCEVGECGASLCSLEVHGRNAAALNSAVLRDERGRFPRPLPAVIPWNDGRKS